jgi:hypothetical protein
LRSSDAAWDVWCGAGVGRGINFLWESVLYSSIITVRKGSPSYPYPILDWMDAALALSWRFNSAMESYVGMPWIGPMVEWGKPSTIFATLCRIVSWIGG